MTHKRGNLRWWLATLVGSLGVCVGIALGCWQLDRATQKMHWQATVQAQSQASRLDAEAVQAALALHTVLPESWLHRPIVLEGQWLPAHTVYLDNRQMNGRPGFFVLTPLQLIDGGVVLVQRGWIARNFQDRSALQPIDTPAGKVTVQGRVASAPARLWEMGDAESGDITAPAIRQNLALNDFAQASQLPLWPFTVVQSGVASEGLLREWTQPASSIATHHGYAFQWFAIAAVLAGMLLWFQFLRPFSRARYHHAQSLL